MMAYFRIADEGCEMLELGPTCGMGLDYGNVPCAGGITLIAPINGVGRIVDSNYIELIKNFTEPLNAPPLRLFANKTWYFEIFFNLLQGHFHKACRNVLWYYVC